MYKNKKILAIIPARGGSKSIPDKNIAKVNGKPLIYYTINEAKKSRYIDHFFVSTNSHKIATVAKKYKAPVPYMQPAKLAKDTSNIMDVLNYAIKWFEKDGNKFDYLLILQPTSPLRTVKDIDESIAKAVDKKADSVMGMVKLVDFSFKKLKRLKKDIIKPLLEDEGRTSSRRQSLSDIYKRNAAIYLTKIDYIKKNDLFGKKSLAHIMPFERSVDINDRSDFFLVDALIRKNKNKRK